MAGGGGGTMISGWRMDGAYIIDMVSGVRGAADRGASGPLTGFVATVGAIVAAGALLRIVVGLVRALAEVADPVSMGHTITAHVDGVGLRLT